MIKLENLLGKGINTEISSSSPTEVRVNSQLNEAAMAKLQKYNIKIKKENDYYLLSPSDGPSREIIVDYLARNKYKLKEKYRAFRQN